MADLLLGSASNSRAIPFAVLGLSVLSLLAVLFFLFVAIPLLLSVVAVVVGKSRSSQQQQQQQQQNQQHQLVNSAMYTGNVWHTRFHPKKHAFTYPIFMFALDLEELDAFHQAIWPLSTWVVKFRETDHMKNREGLLGGGGNDDDDDKNEQPGTTTTTRGANDDDNNKDNNNNSIANRLLRLVAQKTRGRFEPTLRTHRVVVLTHLCYYGYNFNPVSFYYVVNKQSNETEAVVGEVSNTPWTEMYCYVLHPDSTDKVSTKQKMRSGSSGTTTTSVFYSFPKEFHVSPFMEMDYWYDWCFIGVPRAAPTTTNTTTNHPAQPPPPPPITVVNTLRRKGNDRIEFTAKLIMDSNPITPFGILLQVIKLPFFCAIIQVWIHYQAALLFLKGIVYIPHPEGSETTASKVIATIMVPFFAIRDFVNPKCKIA